MNRKKTCFIIAAASVLTTAFVILCLPLVQAQATVPRYEIGPFWTRIPEKWVVGPLGGVCIDPQDHVFVLHRQDGLTKEELTARNLGTGIAAPPVMEFDPQGKLINSWGDAKVLGQYLHDCQFDKDNNIWIVGAQSGFAQKWSHDGKTLLLQVGKSGVFDSSDGTRSGKPLNSNTAQFNGPAGIGFDSDNGDVYIADGHGNGNSRIAVLDRNGKFLRQWRLYHTEAEKNIEHVLHCLRVSKDGFVYVCDRRANRIQVFDKMGGFKKNIDIPKKPFTAEDDRLREYCFNLWRTFPPCTLVQKIGSGDSAISVEFSRDPNQRLMYVVNQTNREVVVLDRQSGKVLWTIGNGTGLFFTGQIYDAIHAIPDSKGNVYVAEDEGRRLQRFRIVAQ